MNKKNLKVLYRFDIHGLVLFDKPQCDKPDPNCKIHMIILSYVYYYGKDIILDTTYYLEFSMWYEQSDKTKFNRSKEEENFQKWIQI